MKVRRDGIMIDVYVRNLNLRHI